MAGPLRIGHLHTTSGLTTPELSVMFAPVRLHVEAAHRANSPEQITSGTGELPAINWRNFVKTYSLSLSAVDPTSWCCFRAFLERRGVGGGQRER